MKIDTSYEIKPISGNPDHVQLVIRVAVHGLELQSIVAMSDSRENVEAFVRDGIIPEWARLT
jgi:hypothetical protein